MPLRPAYEMLGPVGPRDSVQLARVINEIRQGRLNVIGEVTVAVSTDETVITDNRFLAATVIVAMVARDEDSVGLAWWLKERAKGSITLGHDVDAVNDREYHWVALG